MVFMVSNILLAESSIKIRLLNNQNVTTRTVCPLKGHFVTRLIFAIARYLKSRWNFRQNGSAVLCSIERAKLRVRPINRYSCFLVTSIPSAFSLR